jgi:hypothetical protein
MAQDGVLYIQQLLRGQTHSSHACKQFAVGDWFKEDVSPASVFGFTNSFEGIASFTTDGILI